jgi:transmembrane sensor
MSDARNRSTERHARHAPRRVWPIAAAAVVLLLVGGLVWRMTQRDAPAAAGAGTTHWTSVAETRDVSLDDLSHVLVGPSSRFSVADGGRALRLAGVARFDLREDAARPFTLLAEDVIVRTAGALFTADAAALEVRIAVLEGSVEVTPPGLPSLVLNALDRVIITEVGVEPQHDVSVEADFAWADRRMVFENASLRRVAVELERWYGIRLYLVDEALRTRTVTATFDGEPLDQVLETVARAVGARVRREDDSVFLENVAGPRVSARLTMAGRR